LPEALYEAHAAGEAVYFRAGEIDFVFPGSAAAPGDNGVTLRLHFDEANPAVRLIGLSQVSNPDADYLAAKSPDGRPSYFRQIAYKDLYPGINLVFYVNGNHQVEFDWQISPGAAPSAIHFSFAGSPGVRLNSQGALDV